MAQGTKLADLFVRVSTDNTPLKKGLKGVSGLLSSSMKAFGGIIKGGMKMAMSPLGILGMAGGAAGLGLFARKIIGDASTFQDEMTKSLAIMKGAQGPMRDELTNTARAVSREWGIANSEVAKSYFYLASAGLDAAKSIGVLNDMAAFSVAGNFSMKEATDLLTDSLSALGKGGGTAKEYREQMRLLSDMMVKGNTLANTSVQQLADALTNRAAAAMKTFKVETEEGIAVLLAMADAGVKGGKAGMQMTMLLQGVMGAQVANAKAFEKHGVKLYEEGTGKFLGMINLIKQFEQAFAGQSEQQMVQTAAAMKLPLEAMQILFMLMGTSSKIQNNYFEELKKQTGDTARVAGETAGTFKSVIQQMRSAMADFWLVFAGDREGSGVLLPILKEVAGLVTSIANKLREGLQARLSEISVTVQKVVGWFRTLKEIVAASGGVGDMAEKLKTALFSTARTFWDAMVDGVLTFGPIIARNLGAEISKAMVKVFGIISEHAAGMAKEEAIRAAISTLPAGFLTGLLLPEEGSLEKQLMESIKAAFGGETLAGAREGFDKRNAERFGTLGQTLGGLTPSEDEKRWARQRDRQKVGFVDDAGDVPSFEESFGQRHPLDGMSEQDAAAMARRSEEATKAAEKRAMLNPSIQQALAAAKFDRRAAFDAKWDRQSEGGEISERVERNERIAANAEGELAKGSRPVFSGLTEMWKSMQQSVFDAGQLKHEKKLEKTLDDANKARDEGNTVLKEIRDKAWSAFSGDAG